MKFPRHSNYRESGVKWLSELPSHWMLPRFKQVFRERDERSTNGSEELLSVSAYTGVSPRSEIIDDGDFLSRADSFEGYKICHPGDLVMNIMLAWNRGLGFSHQDGIVSPAYSVFEIVNGASSRFLDYLLRSDQYIRYFKAFSAGVIDSRLRLYPDTFLSLNCILPPPSEQLAIAEFLDRETALIDDLVETQERLIELIKEKRQAVISRAVTKGLIPSVPTKDSGVEWLGEIPAHWNVKSLTKLCRPDTKITYGIVQAGPDVEGGIPYIRTSDMSGNHLPEDGYLRTSPEIDAAYSRSKVETGDLVIAIRATVGKTLSVPAYLDGANLTQGTARFSPGAESLGEYVRYCLVSRGAESEFERIGKGATFKEITLDMLRKFRIPVPPIGEQREIIDTLAGAIGKLDALVESTALSIALLQERRAALISAAVTGLIDVRSADSLARPRLERKRVRMIVGATIVEAVANKPNSGRTKPHKLIYLMQVHGNVPELGGSYRREAAGPLDRELVDQMEKALEAAGHVSIEQPGGRGSPVTYRICGKPKAYRSELEGILGARTAILDKLIKDLADLDTKHVEAIATLYAVWNDALLDGHYPADDAIVAGVLNDWHPEKSDKFSARELHTWLGWMRRHELIPKGTGSKTSTGRLFV